MCAPVSGITYFRDAAEVGGKAAAVLTMISAVAIGVIMIVNQGWPGGALPQMVSLSVVAGASFITFLVSCCVVYLANSAIENEIARQQAADSCTVVTGDRIRMGDEDCDEDALIAKNPGTFIKDRVLAPLEKYAIEAPTMVVRVCSAKTGKEKGYLDVEGAHRTFYASHKFIEHLFSNPKIFPLIALKYVAGGVKGPETALRRLVAAYNSGNVEFYRKARDEYEAIQRGHDVKDLGKLLESETTEGVLKQLPDTLIEMFALPSEDVKQTVHTMLKDMILQDPKAPVSNRVVKPALLLHQKIPEAIEKLTSQIKVYNKCRDAEKKIEYRREMMTGLKNLVITCFTASNPSDEQIATWNQTLVGQILPQCKATVKILLSQIAITLELLVRMFKKEPHDTLFPHIEETRLRGESFDCIDPSSHLQKELIELQCELNHGVDPSKRVALIATKADSPMGRFTQGLWSLIDPVNEDNKDKKNETVGKRYVPADGRVTALAKKHGVTIMALPSVILEPALVELRRFEDSRKGRAARTVGGWIGNPGIRMISSFISGMIIGPILDLMPPLNDAAGSAPQLKGVAIPANMSEKKLFEKIIFEEALKHFAPVIFQGAMAKEEFNAIFAKIIRGVVSNFVVRLQELIKDPNMRLLEVRNLSCEMLDSITKSFESCLKN